MAVSLASLLIQETKAAILKTGLGIATSIGLPVTTWQAGDPSRSFLMLLSETLSTLEDIVVGYIRAGFLDYARELAEAEPDDPKAGTWLKIVADQVFNVQVPEATYATTTIILTNTTGFLYDDLRPGDLTFKNSVSDKTYHNTTGGTLASGPATTLPLIIIADEPGAASSAGAGDIDELVTNLTGVTCTNPNVATGTDEQAPATTVQQCRDKLDSLSPNGPKGAYAYVARNSALTGTTGITRVRTYPDSDTGEVIVYLAGPGGGVSSTDRDLAEAAILLWATPLCITPTVLSATNVTVAVTYELWVYKSVNKTSDDLADDIEGALEDLFSSPTLSPIGGNIIPPATTGALYLSVIESTIRGVHPEIFRVVVTAPSGDTALTNGQVAALGTVTPTIHIVVDPA